MSSWLVSVKGTTIRGKTKGDVINNNVWKHEFYAVTNSRLGT